MKVSCCLRTPVDFLEKRVQAEWCWQSVGPNGKDAGKADSLAGRACLNVETLLYEENNNLVCGLRENRVGEEDDELVCLCFGRE